MPSSDEYYCEKNKLDESTEIVFFDEDNRLIGKICIQDQTHLITTCMWGGYGIDRFFPGEMYIHEKYSGTLATHMQFVERITESIYSHNNELVKFIHSDVTEIYLPSSFSLEYQTDYIVNELIFKHSVCEHDLMVLYYNTPSQYDHNYFCYKYDEVTYLIRDRYGIVGCYKVNHWFIATTLAWYPYRYVED